MQTRHYTIRDRDKWDAFVAQEPHFSLMQSWGWGEFKEKLGWRPYRVALEERGKLLACAQMLIKPLPLGLTSLAYIPRGPIGNWLDGKIAPFLFSELHRVARQSKAVFLKIEPSILNDSEIDKALREHHFRSSPLTNQPSTTIVVNLDPSLDNILHNMNKTVRNKVSHSVRMGSTVQKGTVDDLPAFYHLLQITGKRGNFSIRRMEYYEKEWEIFSEIDQVVMLMAFYQDQLLAGHIAVKFGDRAAYFHGGSINFPADTGVNYQLVWEAVKWAKTQGCRTFDLWGIPDEAGRIVSEGNEPPSSDRTDDLWGVYRFKKGFSKKIVCYIGAYDYVYNPVLYKLITNRFLNSNALERAAAWMDGLRTS